MTPRKTMTLPKADTPKAPPAPYDPTPYQQARDDIHELVGSPLFRWKGSPLAYPALLTVPLDLASAGFTVTIEETERGWCVQASRELQPGRVVYLYGSAKSYAACLAQLATSAPRAIGDVERRARRQETEPEVAA